MKAKFEFDLPQDQGEYDICRQAGSMHCVLHEFQEYLIKVNKHTGEDPPFEEVKSKFFGLLDEYEVKL